MKDIKRLKNIEQWEELRKNLSPSDELLIFKYSPVCSISSMVEEDFNLWYSKLPEESKLQCVKIDVVDARDVSKKIEADLKVQHQSPQVIWIKGNSNVKWSASHFDITTEELKSHL